MAHSVSSGDARWQIHGTDHSKTEDFFHQSAIFFSIPSFPFHVLKAFIVGGGHLYSGLCSGSRKSAPSAPFRPVLLLLLLLLRGSSKMRQETFVVTFLALPSLASVAAEGAAAWLGKIVNKAVTTVILCQIAYCDSFNYLYTSTVKCLDIVTHGLLWHFWRYPSWLWEPMSPWRRNESTSVCQIAQYVSTIMTLPSSHHKAPLCLCNRHFVISGAVAFDFHRAFHMCMLANLLFKDRSL